MNIRIQMYLRLFVVQNKFLSVCLPTFFLSLKKHARRCGDKPICIGAVLEDGGKEDSMQITVIRKSDNSVITRIFEDEEGIKEITDDDYEVLIEKDSN